MKAEDIKNGVKKFIDGDWFDLDISEVEGISKRAIKVLNDNKINKMNELFEVCNNGDIIHFRGIGNSTIKKIQEIFYNIMGCELFNEVWLTEYYAQIKIEVNTPHIHHQLIIQVLAYSMNGNVSCKLPSMEYFYKYHKIIPRAGELIIIGDYELRITSVCYDQYVDELYNYKVTGGATIVVMANLESPTPRTLTETNKCLYDAKRLSTIMYKKILKGKYNGK